MMPVGETLTVKVGTKDNETGYQGEGVGESIGVVITKQAGVPMLRSWTLYLYKLSGIRIISRS